MKISPSWLLIASLGALSACSNRVPDDVEHIRTLAIPVVLPGAKPSAVQASQIASLYQNNKQQIDALTLSLKARYLQNVKPQDVFTRDSVVQPVYASLTKLEEMECVNERYMKERNMAGLQQIRIALKPIVRG